MPPSEFDRTQAMAAGESPLGITRRNAGARSRPDVAWKDGIVGRLTSGVAGLLKKAGVKTVTGHGRASATARPSRSRPRPAQVIRAEHVVIATGSEPVELAALPFGGP